MRLLRFLHDDVGLTGTKYGCGGFPADAHVRIGGVRSVANIYQVVAASRFVDELAHAAGRDPLE